MLSLTANVYLIFKSKKQQNQINPFEAVTSDWKTYSDRTNDFSVKYPEQLKPEPLPYGVPFENGVLFSDGGPNEDQIWIETTNKKPMNLPGFTSCKDIQLDSVPAKKCELKEKISEERGNVYNPPITVRISRVDLFRNGTYYWLSLMHNQDSDMFDTFESLLQTFKFIK